MAVIPLEGQIGCSSKNNVVEFVPRNETVTVPIPAHMRESDIGACVCSGSSLEDEGIFDGDILMFKKRFTLRQAMFDICVIYIISTGELVGKKIIPTGDDKVMLRASNDAIPDIVLDKDDIEIKGLLLAFTRMRTLKVDR